MAFKLLLCDVDDTLLDFEQEEHRALTKTFEAFGVAPTPANLEVYLTINRALWQALERGETTQAQLKVERWRRFADAMELNASAQALSDYYADSLASDACPLPGAIDFLKAVSARMPIYLVTNGITSIQRGRFAHSGFAPFIAGLLISQEIGAAKPDPAMLLMAMEKAGVSPAETAMLGDNAFSDMGAAKNAGVAGIHFTWKKPCPGCPAAYHVETLAQAQAILLGD